MSETKPAYILVDTKITDQIAYEDYKAATRPIVEAYGGEYLIRGGIIDIIQNELWNPTRLVLVKFSSIEAARKFLNSPEYPPIKEIRLKNSQATLLIVEGL